MLGTGKYTEQFQNIFTEVKRYLGLQKRYLAMETAEKLTILLSTVAIAIICLVLGTIVLFFSSFALAYWLGELTHSLALGFLIIAAAITLTLIVFFRNRRRWVVRPLARFLVMLFVENLKNDANDGK